MWFDFQQERFLARSVTKILTCVIYSNGNIYHTNKERNYKLISYFIYDEGDGLLLAAFLDATTHDTTPAKFIDTTSAACDV